MKYMSQNTKVELTENEVNLMKFCLNSDTREGQLCDNFSNFNMEDVCKYFDKSEKAIGGICSSLIKKGMGWIEPHDSGDYFNLSELGINTIFDIIDTEDSK